ncbi:heavy metal translocating P-type ATPase [Bowmanella sp. JS7-9]|uniref:Heavy metal translocating P-type ATPase n=1 Tax=Pseudobowmanella zhangzhouensis TaxID=1537679 RepID=A0ABW1XMR4_9ALTE|nr:heavy metal translocating P-type ATPase [Bowmanella sp. JS7-9]TBX26027.1 ATPase P [Bowmanella sp. JS7-9]
MTQSCFHCIQPLPADADFSVTVLGEPRTMCCPGCAAVAQAIVDGGMEDYYRFRTDKAVKAGDTDILQKLSVFDDKQLQQEFVVADGDCSEIQLTVEGITCAACGWLIERQLAKTDGIVQVAVNVAARRATVRWTDKTLPLSALLKVFSRIGYQALPFQPDQHEASYQREKKSYLKKLGLAGLMTMQLMMLAFALYFDWFDHVDTATRQFFHWISLLLCTPVVLYSGLGFYQSAWYALKAGRLNMDVPVTVAIFGAFSASAYATITEHGPIYFESMAMFIFLLLISRYLEHQSRHRAAQISANNMKHLPLTANKMIDGDVHSALARQLVAGDEILVRAGETIPADGVVSQGRSEVDESMLTGEFEPQSRQAGDNVFGGSINQSDVLYVTVSRPLKQSLISQIMRLQELAMAERPAIAGLADQLASYFVAAVLVISALTFWYWYDTGASHAFYIAIAVLVGTCPCALGLATPSALTSAVANLNRKGILIKRGDSLEKLTQITTVALDKTGTLTEGQFSLTSIQTTVEQHQALSLAASLEALSEHPIAKAFSNTECHQVSDGRVHIGQGIEGTINDMRFRIGSAAFIGAEIPAAWQSARVFLADESACIAAFWLSDTLRDDASELVIALADKPIHLLSGDAAPAVQEQAEKLGIEHQHAHCTPEDKLALIRQMQSQGQRVLMVGDGINDGPVLAAADVSVTLAAATDLAKSAADVVLLQPKLMHIPHLLTIAKLCRQKIRQNIGWALGYNLLILPLAVSGILTPWMAVLGMSLSSVIVVTNSLTLLKKD